MATVELKYNPYLSDTRIQFNGKDPHINSLVEKYQKGRLEDWVEKLPEVFRDEMNGYGFELIFSGPDLDFEVVKSSFKRMNLLDESVICTHQKTMEDRETKLIEIKKLLSWLQLHENRTFDFEKFKDENAELFNDSYLIILFHGDGLEIAGKESESYFIENVNGSKELAEINLKDVPIVYVVDHKSIENLQDDIKYMLNRNDFSDRQLFFLIARSMSTGAVERVIKDIGIADPVLISDINTEAFIQYSQLYPVTDYICTFVRKLQQIVEGLKDREENTRQKNEESNKEVYQRLDDLDSIINGLKNSYVQFVNIGNLEIPSSWYESEQYLIERISNWRSKKIKTTNDDDAAQAAQELTEKTHLYYEQFLDDIKNAVSEYLNGLSIQYREIYKKGGQDLEYVPKVEWEGFDAKDDLPYMAHNLLDIKTEEYVMPKDDLFNIFFKQQEQKEKEPVLERTYSYQEWRKYCIDIVRPEADDLINQCFERLKNYSYKTSEAYKAHLSMLIEMYTSKKNQVAMQLSDDEQKFQEDVAWLSELTDQLVRIEQG